MKEFYKTLADAPAILGAKDVKKIIPGLSNAGVYNLFNSAGFPVIIIGEKRKFVTKEAFIKWMESNTGNIGA